MASSVQSFAIPRFLLPQLTWGKTAFTRAGPATSFAFTRPQAYSDRSHYRSLSTAGSSAGPKLSQRNQKRIPQSNIRAAASLGFRREFSATAHHARDHHFDTLKFVQRLRDEGFTEEQAEAMMKVLTDVIEESIQNLTRTMVLREDQERATYTQKVDFAKLRSELMTADSTESSLTRSSHERLTNELAKLNSRLRDDIQRTQASVRLDLNLEKGRIREEANVQELKLKETETRIEQEAAQLRERLEAVKFQTLQWLMGVCTGTAALMLGVWRLLM